jgi:hypothetical protein
VGLVATRDRTVGRRLAPLEMIRGARPRFGNVVVGIVGFVGRVGVGRVGVLDVL